MSRRIGLGVIGLLSLAAALGGCSGASSLGAPVASYGASNVFSPAGYGQTMIDDMHFKVTATGTEATPKQRVEKIARARAAQIGVDQKLEYFKVTSVQHGFTCEKRQEGYKSSATPAASNPTVVLDVVYAKDAADPTFLSSADTYQTLSGELAGEVVAPDAKAAAVQETRAGCGQG
jgi:hypothetical protein